MRCPSITHLVIIATLSVAAGCVAGEEGNGPPAPSSLAAGVVNGGAHLTWLDNSANETGFMIMRMEVGGGDYEELWATDVDVAVYHDASVTAGKTYMYMVMAMAGDEMSESSNEVTISIP